MKGYLVLENGEVFEGEQIGYSKETYLEVVFSTNMAGYIEVLTNPANAGLGIVMTYPLIGNYGVMPEDFESDKVWAKAIFIHNLAKFDSNFRSKYTLDKMLRDNKIPGLTDINTRKLTRLLRDEGSLRGAIVFNIDKKDAEAKIQMMDKLLSDERLTSNQSISTSLINIINHQNKETTPNKIKLIDKILSEDTLCAEPEFTKSLADFLTDKNKQQNIQEQLQIIDTIAKNECFYKNEKFMQQITVSLRMQPLEKVAMVLDKILSDECLYKNEEIVSNLPTALISMCDNDADIKFPLAVFDLYCEDEELQKSKFVP